MITGVTPSTFETLQLNAGVFLKNFEYSGLADKAALAAAIKTAVGGDSWLGATRGGGSFSATPELRQIEVDGKRSEFVGSEIVDGWDVKLSTSLIEVTADNFALALGIADVTKSEKKTSIKLPNEIKDAHYISNIVWVGDLADGRFVLINIDNALAVGGINFQFQDKSEGTLPVELTAHQAGLEDQDYAPCEVVFFEA